MGGRPAGPHSCSGGEAQPQEPRGTREGHGPTGPLVEGPMQSYYHCRGYRMIIPPACLFLSLADTMGTVQQPEFRVPGPSWRGAQTLDSQLPTLGEAFSARLGSFSQMHIPLGLHQSCEPNLRKLASHLAD